jgi:hypothetical protein
LTDIAWAGDFTSFIRSIPRAIVIKIRGSYFRVGLTTMDPATVKQLIRERIRKAK